MNKIRVLEDVNFTGINYVKNMSVCIGKSQAGNFTMCRIDSILINAYYMDLFFLSQISEIISYYELGAYELSQSNENLPETLSIFPYSSLLSADPFSELILRSSTIYLPKYTPFDPDL